MKTFIKHTYRQ